MSRAQETDLRGKDYFSEAEAARYCCVSLRQFQTKANAIPYASFMGKKLYRRLDLQRAIESAFEWQSSINAVVPGSCPGQIHEFQAARSDGHSVQSLRAKLKQHSTQKNSN